MGMFDTINGEQVKCFPVVFLYNGAPQYSMGSLDGFSTGAEVPYRTLYYNYGPDFTVLDINPWLENFDDYRYIVHVIRNGRVVRTTRDSACPEDFDCPVVLDYIGEPLNVRSVEDIEAFITARQKKNVQLDALNFRWDQLNAELQPVAKEYREEEDKKSPKALELGVKIEEILAAMWKEEQKNSDKVKEICSAFEKKWRPEMPDDCIRLGEWLDIFVHSSERVKAGEDSTFVNWSENVRISAENICKMLDEDKELLSRYLEWHGASAEEEKEINDTIIKAKAGL